MKPTGVIPSLITLGNAVCGFSAIYKIANHDYLQAAWLILLAMIFDAFDGKVARLTKQTSDFGGQLDSLSDAVSFGIAPALLIAMMNKPTEGIAEAAPAAIESTPDIWLKATWFFCLLFALCAILRLARYNVEKKRGTKEEDSFTGLPSPAAAGMVAALVILSVYIPHPREALRLGYLTEEQAEACGAFTVKFLLPLSALFLGYLMVSSRIRYVHLLNRYVSGKRTFEYLAGMVFVVFVAAAVREIALAIGFFAYAASGPVGFVLKEVRRRSESLEAAPAESTRAPRDGT